MKKGCLKGLGCCVFLGLLVAGAGFLSFQQLLSERYPSSMPDPVVVEVRPGTTARSVLEELERLELVRNADVARWVLVRDMGDPPIQAGEYRFEGPATVHERLVQLVEGQVILYPLTVIEGLTLEETAASLAARGHGDEEVFLEAMRNPEPIAHLDPSATDLEGYLFPDTYSLPAGATERQIVSTLVGTFLLRYEQDLKPLLDARPESNIDTPLREVVTLAAIVEKEALLDEERPLIAGVYAHRLRKGIALYADPTVIFGLKKLGRWDGNLRKADLKFDTPYNTYVRSGLPPGPICSPGLASLKAAISPQQTDLLYFVSRNDGSHVFAKTLSEHNRNVNKWQRQYWQKKWAEEKRQQRDATPTQ